MQQADGVAGRGCVENDVRVILRQRRIGQQGRELIEGGDFRGAGTRQGFFDAAHHVVGQHASHRADNAVTVGLRCRLWVDFEREQPGHGGNGGDVIADLRAEHLPHVRRRVGADEQDALACGRQLHRGGTGNGRLADAPFAGEEKEPSRMLEKMHDIDSIQQQRPPAQQDAGADSGGAIAIPSQRASSVRLG